MTAWLRFLLATPLLAAHALPAQAGSDSDVSCYQKDGSEPAEKAKVEQDCLAQLPSMANRAGDRLVLVYADGQTKAFQSKPDACEAGRAEECIDFRLVESVASLDVIVIQRSTYENRDFLLIDRNQGTTFETGDRPMLSPDRSTFVVAMGSEVSEPTGIEIWSRRRGRLAKEWSYHVPSHKYELYSFDRWIGNDQIALKVETNAGSDPNLGTRKLFLKRSRKGWTRIDE